MLPLIFQSQMDQANMPGFDTSISPDWQQKLKSILSWLQSSGNAPDPMTAFAPMSDEGLAQMAGMIPKSLPYVGGALGGLAGAGVGHPYLGGAGGAYLGAMGKNYLQGQQPRVESSVAGSDINVPGKYNQWSQPTAPAPAPQPAPNLPGLPSIPAPPQAQPQGQGARQRPVEATSYKDLLKLLGMDDGMSAKNMMLPMMLMSIGSSMMQPRPRGAPVNPMANVPQTMLGLMKMQGDKALQRVYAAQYLKPEKETEWEYAERKPKEYGEMQALKKGGPKDAKTFQAAAIAAANRGDMEAFKFNWDAAMAMKEKPESVTTVVSEDQLTPGQQIAGKIHVKDPMKEMMAKTLRGGANSGTLPAPGGPDELAAQGYKIVGTNPDGSYIVTAPNGMRLKLRRK